MKNLTSLCAAQPHSPRCSGFPFRIAKPHLFCLVMNLVCSHQGFSWKKHSHWSPAMSKSTFNCGTARSCMKVDVAETRSTLRCATAVILIKLNSRSFSRVSQPPPVHLSSGDQSHHKALWLPDQIISIWPSVQAQMVSGFEWAFPKYAMGSTISPKIIMKDWCKAFFKAPNWENKTKTKNQGRINVQMGKKDGKTAS